MFTLPRSPREWFLALVWSELGTPYKWGGSDPVEGLDCSGMVIFHGSNPAVELYPAGYDNTAAGLFELHALRGDAIPEDRIKSIDPGWLIFWAKEPDPKKIIHVEVGLTLRFSIGAVGGWSDITTPAAAAKADAFVKVHDWTQRGGFRFFANPFREM